MKMKFVLPILFFLLVMSINSDAQNDSLIDSPIGPDKSEREKMLMKNAEANSYKITKGEEVFSIVEEMPQFPGGENELMKYLITNLKYPATAMEQGIQGKVFLKFIVTKTGKIDSVTVAKSVYRSLDEEAIRVVKSMHEWKPGKQNGKAVNVYYNLPINFKLEEPAKKKGEKK